MSHPVGVATPGTATPSVAPQAPHGVAPHHPAPVAAGHHPAPQLQEKEADQIVLNYLRKKGYKQAEAAFKSESKISTTGARVEDLAAAVPSATPEAPQEVIVSSHSILYHNKNESPSSFKEHYIALREWVGSSLDTYRQELFAILYPIFLHLYVDMIYRGFYDDARSFMEQYKKDHLDLHSDEITELQAVATVEHLSENEIVRLYKTNRYPVKLSRYSYELLINYLHEKKYMSLLGILNQYLTIKVFAGQPSQSASEEYNALVGKPERDVAIMNKKEVYWGLFEEQVPKTKEKSPTDTEPALKKIKKEEGPKEVLKKAPIAIPKLSEQQESELLEDINKRASLSATSLPSICFYTVFHAHNSLNCMDISSDCSYIAAGMSDSSVRIWDLKKDRTPIVVSQGGNGKRKTKEDFSVMIGHSGPVYGASFSPDAQFLITCSEDHTARLWSLETRSNLVCYKGHQYPIWDVDFSSFGYYFATASHDRSARLWSTDRVSPLRIFAGHLSDVNCVKFHPNCSYIATGSSDKSLRLWEINSGVPVRIFTGHSAAINCLAISPDGKLLASAADDNKIMLYDLGTSRRIATFSGHQKTIWSLDFSCESSILASGSADNTVCLWDVNAAPKKKTEDGSMELSDGTQPTKSEGASPEMLKMFPTKETPVYKVQFTKRNLLLAGGPFAHTESE